jgi:hypothetical protein
VLEEDVAERGFFARYAGDPVIKVPVQADPSWVTQEPFRLFPNRWKEMIGRRRDFFLAYSSKLQATTDSIRTILNRVGATVLDWKQDSVAGKTILDEAGKNLASPHGLGGTVGPQSNRAGP